MKKIISILVFSVVVFSAAAQKKKVAVVSFYADKVIDLSAVDPSVNFIAQNTEMSNDPNFNLSEPLQEFFDQFFASYVDEFDFELIPQEQVLSLPEYQNYKPRLGDTKNIGGQANYIAVDGYKVIPNYGSGYEIKKLKPIAEALGADAVMIVRLNYRFNKTGIGKLGYYSIQAVVNVDLFSKDNKSIFQFHELAGSKKKAVMVGGIPVMSSEKILPMCKDATIELIEDMNKKIDRLAKKANRKLK
ncbi:hypothetical protein [Nonlabens xiamenensis]|uniref:hypothetical protein n=1 Tax=Nonlabens xiamenensis TaxID=2341043 RepID=UPI000F6138D5|nr:hypothetical protein [Nonlabens xiamenensis]